MSGGGKVPYGGFYSAVILPKKALRKYLSGNIFLEISLRNEIKFL
jgi:hypothetical protein